MQNGKMYVYVVSGGRRATKVGRTNNPKRRLHDLQVSSPVKLRTDWFLEVPAERATEIELMAHDALACRRSHGEWFRIDAQRARRAVELAAADAIHRTPATWDAFCRFRGQHYSSHTQGYGDRL